MYLVLVKFTVSIDNDVKEFEGASMSKSHFGQKIIMFYFQITFLSMLLSVDSNGFFTNQCEIQGICMVICFIDV